MTETCLPRDTLKRYLSGAIDAEQINLIEAHLATCADCEQTIVQLEADPDTLLASMRDLSSVKSQANSLWADSPGVVERAVAAVRSSPGAARGPAGPVRKLDQIGAYELLQQIGQGSMGQVFMARHISLDKRVAIKLLFAHSPQSSRFDFVSRFQREMKAAGRLDHPSIVSATDAGEVSGTHYLVMEFIDGLDLSRIARAVGPLSIANACELMRQAALGLSHAHAEGIVHRDIKPSNLMLDGQGRLKITDFGLAQWSLWDGAAGELTTVGQLMGTLDYMAPEQAERTDGVDYRADLYALGATLFRLLTGRAPLAAAPNMTLLEKVRLLGSQSAPALSSLRSDAPESLVNLVASLLSRQPADRPASAAHVAEALQPLCKGHQLAALLKHARERDVVEAAVAVNSEPIAPRAEPTLFVAPPTAQQPPLPPPKNRRWPWVAAACAPLVILAGVWLTLELQKGQLVIQSDVANVNVKIVRDGQTVEQLTIQPGAHVTRLRADEYEVVIDAPSDQVTIDKGSFALRQGETVVAIVKQLAKPDSVGQTRRSQGLFDQMRADADNKMPRSTAFNPVTPTPGAPTLPLAVPAAALPTPTIESTMDSRRTNPQPGQVVVEPVFGTKDLSVERMLQNLEEASTVELKRLALLALNEKLGPDDGAQATPRLLAIARNWSFVTSASQPGGWNRMGNWTHIDDGLLSCLAQCNPSKSYVDSQFVDLLHSELLVGDRVWVKRWLASLARLDYRNQPLFLPSEIVALALEYAVSDRFAHEPFKAFDSEQCQLWAEFVKKQLVGNRARAQLYSKRFIDLVASHQAMGRLAVLQLDPYRLDERIEILHPASGQTVLEESLAQYAKKVLIDAQGTPEELAHAAYRLATSGPFVERWYDELRSALRSRIKVLNSSDAERTFSLLPKRPYAPENWQPVPTQFGEQWPATCDVSAEQLADAPQFRGVRYTNSEVLAYLALVKRLRLVSELDEELTVLFSRCIDQQKPLTDLVFARHEFAPKVGGGFNKESIDALAEPWRSVPASAWMATLVERGISNLANEDIHGDSQLSQAMLVHNTMVDLKFLDRNQDQRLSAKEAEGMLLAFPLADNNGDGSFDYEELLDNRRRSTRRIAAEFLQAARGQGIELSSHDSNASSTLPAHPSDPSDVSKSDPVPEMSPIYEGRTLDEWLAIAEQDQSLAMRLKAFGAAGALTPSSRAAEVTERLFKMAVSDTHRATLGRVAGLLESLNNPNSAISDIASSSDGEIFGCWLRINSPEAFQKLLTDRLLTGDDQWTSRWWLQLVGRYPVSSRHRAPMVRLSDEVVASWLEREKFEDLGEKSLPIAVNYFYLLMQQDAELARTRFPVLLERMTQCSRLGKAYVLQERSRLSWRLDSQSDNRDSVREVPPGEQFMEDATIGLAKDWLLQDDSSAEVCARAAGLLATTSVAVESWRDELIPQLRKRLMVVCASPERLSAELSMNGMGRDEGWGAIKWRSSRMREKGVLSENVFSAAGKSPVNFAIKSQHRYVNNELACYAALIKRLKAVGELADELLACAKLMSDSWLTLESQLVAAENDQALLLPPWPFRENALKQWPNTTSKMWREYAMFERLSEMLETLPSSSEAQTYLAALKKSLRQSVSPERN